MEKKKLLKWHLWEFQERRRWLDVHRSYIERKIKEGALLFSTSEVNDAKKQVKEIEDRIIHWIKLESEEAKKIMEE